MKRRVMYVELKSDSNPAWIGWVEFSKSGRSVYYRGRRLQPSIFWVTFATGTRPSVAAMLWW